MSSAINCGHGVPTDLTCGACSETTDALLGNIDATLAERGGRYGSFVDHARIAQALQDTLRGEPGWTALAPDQRQALTVICDKMARMLNGDPDYRDNWHDIVGYAKLVDDRMKREGF